METKTVSSFKAAARMLKPLVILRGEFEFNQRRHTFANIDWLVPISTITTVSTGTTSSSATTTTATTITTTNPDIIVARICICLYLYDIQQASKWGMTLRWWCDLPSGSREPAQGWPR